MESTTGRNMLFSGGVGVATPDAMTAEDAIRLGGLDWKVGVVDAGFRVNGGVFKSSRSGTRAVVKLDDEGKPETDFGYVGRRWTAIQNIEMFDWCNALVDDSGAKFESAWSLYGGREVGLTMRFPDGVLIGGVDPVDTYLLLRGRHDGTGSVQGLALKMQLSCTNMINIAVKGAVSSVRIPHLANATQKLAAARDSLRLTFAYDEAFNREMEALVHQTIAEDQADAIIKSVLETNRFGAIEAKVNAVKVLRAESPTMDDSLRNTRYGVLKAFTEWTDWQRVAKTPQARAIDMIDGRVKRAKDQVFAALSAA